MLDTICKIVANDIKENLPKLPICKNYFLMLKVICGVCYFFSSLKNNGYIPSLNKI